MESLLRVYVPPKDLIGFNPSYSFTEYQNESALMVYVAKNAELTTGVFSCQMPSKSPQTKSRLCAHMLQERAKPIPKINIL